VLDILPESANQSTAEEATRDKFGYILDKIKTALKRISCLHFVPYSPNKM